MDKDSYIDTNRFIDFEKTNKRFDEVFGEKRSNWENVVRCIKGLTKQIIETLTKLQTNNT
jgi:hypothetical protein